MHRGKLVLKITSPQWKDPVVEGNYATIVNPIIDIDIVE